MKPWEILGRARTPDGVELTLSRHPSEYRITADGESLMSSRAHGSEEALATLGCVRARMLAAPQVLVGGLGMGFTLRAALDVLPPTARIVVVEFLPEVVDWNRGPLGELAKHPIDDPRVRVETRDVLVAMRSNPGAFDAILLDVDNGPTAMASASNVRLYDANGIAVARDALKAGGVLAVWSASDDRRFERWLRAAGFSVQRHHVRSRVTKGRRHTILLAHNGPAGDP